MAKPQGSLWVRSMSLGRSFGLALAFGSLISVAGCMDDPQDIKTWVKKLEDVREQKDALRNIERLATAKERPANIDDAVAPVSALFKKSKDPQHLKTLTKIRSAKAVDLFIEQLDYSDENYENASVAATGLLELASLDDKGREAAKKAVPDLVKALDKKLPIKTRANVVKVEAMKALTAIKDPAAVPALMKVVEVSADEQDFFLNREAAKHLGEFADARSAGTLVRGLFMTGRGGDIFVPCRYALARIGEPAVDKVVEAMQRKNAAIEEDAKKYEFLPGLIVQKMAIILGDLRSKKALPALIKELEKKDDGMAPDCLNGNKQCVSGHQSVLLAIGMTDVEKTTAKTLIGIVSDAKRHPKLRSAAAEALNLMNATDGSAAILAAAKTPFLKPPKEKDDLPELDQEKAGLAAGAITQFGRLVDKDETAAVDGALKALNLPKELLEADIGIAFQNALARVELARDCKKDVACYGKALDEMTKEMDSIEASKSGKDDREKMLLDIRKARSAAKAEKAAFMLGRMGRDALPFLSKHIAYKDSAARIGIMLALSRISTKADAEILKAIQAQIDIDKTKDKASQGLADEMRITHAIIANR